MDFLKAQSAIEYITTYGWMLLVVALVGGLIYALASDQNLESESVEGLDDSDLVVDDYEASGEDGFQFSLRSISPEPSKNVLLCLSNEELGIEELCRSTKSSEVEKLEEAVISFEDFKRVNQTYEYDAYLKWNPQGINSEKVNKGTIRINYAPITDNETDGGKGNDPELKTVDAIKSNASFIMQINLPGLLDDETTKKLIGQRLPRPLIPQYDFNVDNNLTFGQDYNEMQTSIETYLQKTITNTTGISSDMLKFDDIGMISVYADQLKAGSKLVNPTNSSSNPILNGNAGLVAKIDVSEEKVDNYTEEINNADNNLELTTEKGTFEGFTRWKFPSDSDSRKSMSLVLLDTNEDSRNLYGFGTIDKMNEMIDTVQGQRYDSTESILAPEKNGYVNHIGIKGLELNDTIVNSTDIVSLAKSNRTSMTEQEAENLEFDTIDFAYSTNQNNKIALQASINIESGPTATDMVNLTKTSIKFTNKNFEESSEVSALDWLENDLKLYAEDPRLFELRLDETVQRYQEIINNTASVGQTTVG